MYRCFNTQTQVVTDKSIGGAVDVCCVDVSSNAMGAHGEARWDRPLYAITSGYRAREELDCHPVW